jgi:imidazolonepropionase-like amidohydrolase
LPADYPDAAPAAVAIAFGTKVLCPVLANRRQRAAGAGGARAGDYRVIHCLEVDFGHGILESMELPIHSRNGERNKSRANTVPTLHMPTLPKILQVLLCASVLLAFTAQSSSAQPAAGEQAQLVLHGGTIYPSPTADPIRDGVIVIRDGRISAVGASSSVPIPDSATTLDCSGMTITAGFWNSHVHFMERKWANAAEIPAAELATQIQDMLTRYGFTSVFDTGSVWENTRQIRDRIESGGVPGPRIRSTGSILVPKDAAPAEVVADVLGFMRYTSPEIGDPRQASAAAARLLDAGVDGVKLYAQTFWPPRISLPEGAIEAAVNQAHRRGKPAFAHPTSREGLMASVQGGVDVLVHTTPQSGPWDDTVIQAMKDHDVALIPTLQLWDYEVRHDRISDRKAFVGTGVGQLRDWVAAGGTVLFGTDVGYLGDYDPSLEYTLMAEAGMNFGQILAALTTAPSERLGEPEQQGRIAAGLPGDIVVLAADPSKSIRAFAGVRYTIRGGQVIYRAGN